MRLLYLLPVATLVACKGPAPTAAAAVPAHKAAAAVAVQTATVKTEKLPAIIELSGTLEADERSEVAAAIGGLVIGVAENLAGGYIGSGYKEIASFAIILLVLMVRPHGLFGEKDIERV